MDTAGILDQIESTEDLSQVVLPAADPKPKGVIQKINYSHDGMINLIIANRGITQDALAKHFGYSPSWISQVMSSEMFQARLAERAQEIEDPTLRATVEEGFQGLVRRSMELLKEKLDRPAAEVEAGLLLRTLDISSRALGYGAREAPTVVINNNQVENHLEVLGGRLTGLLQRKKSEIIQPALEQQT
jgi:transcriptional regulator with XRE-family HTH domain